MLKKIKLTFAYLVLILSIYVIFCTITGGYGLYLIAFCTIIYVASYLIESITDDRVPIKELKNFQIPAEEALLEYNRKYPFGIMGERSSAQYSVKFKDWKEKYKPLYDELILRSIILSSKKAKSKFESLYTFIKAYESIRLIKESGNLKEVKPEEGSIDTKREMDKQADIKYQKQNDKAEKCRLEKETAERKKLEALTYEYVKVIVCSFEDNKPKAVLRKKDNTYAFVERKSPPFELNSIIKLNKKIIPKFKWISETDFLLINKKNKLELRRQKELKGQQIQNQLFDEFWEFIKSDNGYYEIISKNIQNDESQPFSVYTHIQKLSRNCQVWNELGQGINILTSEEQLSQYIYSYGKMHKAKLVQAFSVFIPKHLDSLGSFANIIDYGCGQGLGTVALIDYLNASGTACDYTKTILIEPSIVALRRASTHVVVSLKTLTWPAHTYQQIFPISKKISDISEKDLETWDNAIKFHVFSNILDIEEFEINKLCEKISNTQKGINYFICVSPNFYADGTNKRNQRLRAFMSFFNVEPISHRFSNIGSWTRYEIVFMVDFDKYNLNKT
jgi:hypothetical protein